MPQQEQMASALLHLAGCYHVSWLTQSRNSIVDAVYHTLLSCVLY
jgi:hypothetical protein